MFQRLWILIDFDLILCNSLLLASVLAPLPRHSLLIQNIVPRLLKHQLTGPIDAFHLFSARLPISTTRLRSPWLSLSVSLSQLGRVSSFEIRKSREGGKLRQISDALCVNFVPVYRNTADRIGQSDIGLRNDSKSNKGDEEIGGVREIENKDQADKPDDEAISPEIKTGKA